MFSNCIALLKNVKPLITKISKSFLRLLLIINLIPVSPSYWTHLCNLTPNLCLHLSTLSKHVLESPEISALSSPALIELLSLSMTLITGLGSTKRCFRGSHTSTHTPSFPLYRSDTTSPSIVKINRKWVVSHIII